MDKTLHILMLVDSLVEVVCLNHELRQGDLSFCTKRVATKEQLLQELRTHQPDLILSDHGGPNFNVYAALAIARDEHPFMPFIFLAGPAEIELAIECLKNGANDCVLTHRLASLVGAIKRVLREAEARAKRHETEKALRQSEERFRRLVDGIKDYGIFMLGPEGCISSWNMGAQWITGYQAGEMVGQRGAILYCQEDGHRGKPEEDLRLAAAQGRFEEEAWRLCKAGTRFWARVSINALRDETGRLRGFAQVLRDLTDRREARGGPAPIPRWLTPLTGG